MADTHYYTKGTFDDQEVFFGPRSKNDTGALSQRRERIGKSEKFSQTVWITNTKGDKMTVPMGLTTAKYLVNQAGRKFEYAKEEDIPYVPKEKVRPYDSEKRIGAQEAANVEMTGRDVVEMIEQGVDPLEGVVSYKEMRAIAKENDINTFKMKKAELGKILREKGLIQ